MPKKKRVYFAGSIRGGRQDAELYKRIIEYIQQRHVVLPSMWATSPRVKQRA